MRADQANGATEGSAEDVAAGCSLQLDPPEGLVTSAASDCSDKSTVEPPVSAQQQQQQQPLGRARVKLEAVPVQELPPPLQPSPSSPAASSVMLNDAQRQLVATRARAAASKVPFIHASTLSFLAIIVAIGTEHY